jgi:hypothetical protein
MPQTSSVPLNVATPDDSNDVKATWDRHILAEELDDHAFEWLNSKLSRVDSARRMQFIRRVIELGNVSRFVRLVTTNHQILTADEYSTLAWAAFAINREDRAPAVAALARPRNGPERRERHEGSTNFALLELFPSPPGRSARSSSDMGVSPLAAPAEDMCEHMRHLWTLTNGALEGNQSDGELAQRQAQMMQLFASCVNTCARRQR